LDIQLPDGNGRDLCQEIRKQNDLIPILMITAKRDEESAVQCLQAGADDYIRKPYGSQELVARMVRLLERKKKLGNSLLFHSLKMDLQQRLAWAGQQPLNLGKREFDILALLVRRSREAVTRNEILDSLGEEAELYDRTIDSHLSHLRKKLKDAGATDVQISPIYGIGYRLDSRPP
jgi:DNA-binding response OmpR family regulator